MGSDSADISASGKHWRVGEGFVDHLQGAVLHRLRYEQLSDEWDHDHCVACDDRFTAVARAARFPLEAPLVVGYSTTPGHGPETEWVCEDCVARFKDRFAWKLETLNTL